MNIDEVIRQENEKISISRSKVRNTVILTIGICCMVFALATILLWHFYFNERINAQSDIIEQQYSQIKSDINSKPDSIPEQIVIYQNQTSNDQNNSTNEKTDSQNTDNTKDKQSSEVKLVKKPTNKIDVVDLMISKAKSLVGTKMSGWELVQKCLVNAKYQSTINSGNAKYVDFLLYGTKVSLSAHKFLSGDIFEFNALHDPIAADFMGIYVGDGDIIMSLNDEIKLTKIPKQLKISRVIRML